MERLHRSKSNSSVLPLIVLVTVCLVLSACKKDPPVPYSLQYKFEPILDRGNILDIGVDSNRVFAHNTIGDLIIYDRYNKSFNFLNTFNSWITPGNIVGIQPIDNQQVVIGERSRGFIIHDQQSLKLDRNVGGFRAFNARKPHSIISIGGIVLFGSSYTYFGNDLTQNQLESYSVCTANQDTLWVGSHDIGLDMYKPISGIRRELRLTKSFSRLAGGTIDSCIDLQYINKDTVYLLTRKSLFVRHQGKWHHFQTGNTSRLVATARYRSDYYLCDEEAVYQLSNNKITMLDQFTETHPNGVIRSMDVDEMGRVWLATSIGIYLYHPDH